MALKRYQQKYTDGIVHIYEDVSPASSFGAKTNVDSMDDLNLICSLRFQEAARRQQDLAWAEMVEINLTRKVKTPLCKLVQSGHQALIGQTLYNISQLDTSLETNELYLYLTEVRKIAT